MSNHENGSPWECYAGKPLAFLSHFLDKMSTFVPSPQTFISALLQRNPSAVVHFDTENDGRSSGLAELSLAEIR